MQGQIFIIFYNGMGHQGVRKYLWQLMKLLIIPGARLQHCCLCVFSTKTGKSCMYHVGLGTKSSWRNAKLWHRKFPPSAAVCLGEHTVDWEAMQQIKSVRYSLFSVILWYVFTRWFSSWKPKTNCTMKTCEILRLLGYDVDDYVTPSCLYKELTNANDYDCWSSESWQNNFSKYYSKTGV